MKKTVGLLLLVAAIFFGSCASDKGTAKVVMETTAGTMEFLLYGETPQHRDNFIKLASESYFDSLLFHRVIKDFMIQGGDPDSKYAEAGVRLGEGGPSYRLDAEFNPALLHKRGALAAAREGDMVNPKKRSSASQFYIVWGKVYTPQEIEGMSRRMSQMGMGELTPEQKKLYTTVGGTPFLDGQYTVFGEITKGLEVVDKIQNVATDGNDRPVEDVRILNVKIVK
jgi:peptidyl-prolyl cis-trans isomerase B (cyclophilin B)